MSGALRVISPGALSTVQDMGRHGYQRFGVSVSGAADPDGLWIGNRLVGNERDAAAVEIAVGGAEFEFTRPSIFAITGGDLTATVDGIPAPSWMSLIAGPGTRVTFGAPIAGLRAYLCVAGGIATPPALGSRSTHGGSRLGGLTGAPLAAGDELPIGPLPETSAPGLEAPPELVPALDARITARVVGGPQEDAFTQAGVDTFYGSTYTVTEKSDRQGVRLDGPLIEARGGRYDIVSDAVTFGAVQVPGDGKPIVLLADRQTTGGYAKIGVVARVDLSRLGQARPGDAIRFERIDIAAAQSLARERHRLLRETPLVEASRTRRYFLGVDGIDYEIGLSEGIAGSAGSALHVTVNGEHLLVEVQEM